MADQKLDIPTISPKRMLAFLDTVVIGQESAKKALVGALYLHVVRACMDIERDIDGDKKRSFESHKTNILLTGPTGVGKTLMIRSLCEHLNLPHIEIDATQLSPEGYKGETLNDAIGNKLGALTNKDLIKYAVVFIDEFDKLGSGHDVSSNGGNFNEAKQSNILKAVEGTDIKTYNTQHMLFIFGGNFQAMREARKPKKTIGFGGQDSKAIDIDSHVELVKAGIIPELSGRISLIGELKELTGPQYVRVLFRSKASPYHDYMAVLKKLGKNPQLKLSDIRNIIKKARAKKTGLRSLNSILAEAFLPLITEE